MVSLILEKFDSTSITYIIQVAPGNPFETSCVRGTPWWRIFFIHLLLYGTKEPFYNLLRLFGSLEFGESLANFFLRIHTTWVYFESASWRSSQSRHKSPPVSFLFQRTGLGAQRSLGINVQQVSKFSGIKSQEWRITKTIFLGQ